MARDFRLAPRFSAQEYELVVIAAAVAGVTPTGWLAKAGVDLAAGIVRPAPSGLVGVLEELLEARRQVQRFSVLVNQAVAKWHATDQLPPELLSAVALVGRVLPRLEDAALSLRQHRGHRPAGGPATAKSSDGSLEEVPGPLDGTRNGGAGG